MLEELEPRLLFSADAAGVFTPDIFDPQQGVTDVVLDDQLEPLQQTENQAETLERRLELVFVDTDTPDYQQLVDGIMAEQDDRREIEVILLDNERDGITQITEALEERQDVDALHLVSHGDAGHLNLGNSELSAYNLGDHQYQLQSWNQFLDTDADVLIYGCNLAASEDGQLLIEQLAFLTRADIAASDDLTGSAELGGDYDLEHQTGLIEADSVFNAKLQENWQGVLVDVSLETYDPGFAALADNAYEVKSGQSWGQTFSNDSPGATYEVNKIELVLYKEADATAGQTITVSLRDSWNGTVLGTADISSDSLAVSEAWVSLDIGSATLNDNTTYYIQVDSDGDGKVHLGVDTSSSYTNGDVVDKDGTPEAGKAAAFKIIQASNAAPVITSNGSGPTAAINVNENITAVTTVTATDADLDTPTYTIVGGDDAGFFSLGLNDGVLAFSSAPDYENKLDFDGDNVYEVIVQANDGNTGTDTQTISVTVDNVAISAISATGNLNVEAGATYTLNLSVDEDATSWTINWGDGDIDTVVGDPSSVTHEYLNAGFTNNVTVSAVDADGVYYDSALLVANAASGTDGYILRYAYDPATGQADWANRQTINTATPSDLDWAGDVIVGPDGYIYATGYQSQNIVRFDQGTGNQDLTFEITTPNHFVSIDFGPDGLLYALSDSKWVKSYDVSDPANIINVDSWTLSYTPEEMAFGTDGSLYIGKYVSSGVIYKHDISDNTWTDDAAWASPPDGAGERTEQFAFGPDGNLYVARTGGSILKYDLSGPSPAGSIFATPGKTGTGWPDGPTGLAFGPDGKLYLTTVNQVLRYDLAAPGTPDIYVPTSGGLNNPWFTTFTPNHQVYINSEPTGTVSISGTSTEDQVLTASNTLADRDGLGTISYQWQRDGVDIGGATGSTYTLAQTDVGTTITVDASYTDGLGVLEQVSSAGVGPISNLNDAPVGVPTISGTAQEDQVLTANTGGISDEDGLGAFSYQWQRDGVDIGSATGGTYTLTQTDVGAQITVEVSYTDGESTPEGPLLSAQTAVVTNLNDAPVGVPTISGTAQEDQVLTANTGGISDEDGLGAFSYQWQRDGVDIGGATGSTYTLTQSDVGSTITVDASYTDGESNPELVSSAGVGPVANLNDAPVGVPTIAGTAQEDQVLTANTGGISDEDGLGAFSYQWQRDGVDIGGATGGTYTLTQADVGAQITVEVSYTDGESTPEGPLLSAQTAVVTNLNDAPTGSVNIAGTPTEDQVLTASNTLADEDGLGAISYQWQRDGVDIGGATGSTYTLTQTDVGSTITVDASYTDGEGTPELVSSAGAGPIANLNDAPVGIPTISGTAQEDQVLTANTGGISDEDGLGTFSYQWQRDGVDIGGATGSTYTLTQTDVGARITVEVSYTDGESTPEGPLLSAQTAVVTNLNDAPVGVPTISGTAQEDQVLTANTGGISDEDGLGAFSYQWQRDGVDIGGATGGTYTLTQTDVGARITVEVSYTDGESTPEGPLLSAQTAVVTNLNDAPVGVPTISGTAQEDQVLTANTGGISDEDGLGAFSYQWQRDGVDIGGAT
ncbi:MAG: DUF4347 domain-containing protein, partial [Halieaceae bacterium]